VTTKERNPRSLSDAELNVCLHSFMLNFFSLDVSIRVTHVLRLPMIQFNTVKEGKHTAIAMQSVGLD
jgi:hypothetical protein